MSTSHPWSVRHGLLALILAVVLASCGGSAAAGGANPVTTALGQTDYDQDANGMPDLELSDLPESGRVVLPELEGKSLEDSIAWAEETGWEQIQIIDLGPDEETFYTLEGRPPALRIKLKHVDGIIVEAVAG